MAKGAVNKILYLLKTRGEMSIQALANELDMTSMGARKHLQSLAEQHLVRSEDRAEKQGRPTRYFSLAEKGHARFPDRHSDLTLSLIDSVRSVFGEQGLEQLISQREQQTRARYQARLETAQSVAAKLSALADVRSEEGYMAEVIEAGEDAWLLVEHHCPICAAASQCQGFCRAELAIFRECLSDSCQVERSEYLLDGDRRCAYKITLTTSIAA